MAGHHIPYDKASGTVGGTLLAIVAQVDTGDMIRTVVLAILGAVVSFMASHGCKAIYVQLITRKRKRRDG